MTVLDDLVARTRARLAREEFDFDLLREQAAAAARSRTAHAFRTALEADRINIIAEIKAASPSAGVIVEEPDVERIARDYRDGGAAAISVVTEPELFRGSRDWIRRARTAGLPVIMKDFIVEPEQILEAVGAGADAVLLLASVLDQNEIHRFIRMLGEYGCDAVVEVHNRDELTRAVDAHAPVIGVNNRDLHTFQVDLGTSERLAPRIPAGVIRVAESGIGSYADIQRLSESGFSAFLVGESLLRQNDRAAAVRRLRGERET